MSDTPRTDAAHYYDGIGMRVGADFARKLERELAKANLRIKELESEGDRAIAFARQGSRTCADAVWYRVRNKL